MGAYTNQLSSVPYRPGTNSSPVRLLCTALSTRSVALPSSSSAEVQAAGGLVTPRSADGGFTFVGSAIAAAAAAGAVALL